MNPARTRHRCPGVGRCGQALTGDQRHSLARHICPTSVPPIPVPPKRYRGFQQVLHGGRLPSAGFASREVDAAGRNGRSRGRGAWHAIRNPGSENVRRSLDWQAWGRSACVNGRRRPRRAMERSRTERVTTCEACGCCCHCSRWFPWGLGAAVALTMT
jgi:hypothetical protein